MKHIVGVAEMHISKCAGDVIVTHALGSCLGICAHDASAGVGGLIHVMLPSSRVNPDKAKINPCMFVDTGVPEFFRSLYHAGAQKQRIMVKVAGGAAVNGNGSDSFAIGRRNFVMLKKVFWKNGVMIETSDVGGKNARTMYLEVGSGSVWVTTAGRRSDL